MWKNVIKEQQLHWNHEVRGRHLHLIQNRVGSVRNRGANRKEEVIINRLKIGHSNTAHFIS